MDCEKACHGICVNMTKDDAECLFSQDQSWRCSPCSKALSSPDKSKNDILHDMLKEAEEERARMDLKIN